MNICTVIGHGRRGKYILDLTHLVPIVATNAVTE